MWGTADTAWSAFAQVSLDSVDKASLAIQTRMNRPMPLYSAKKPGACEADWRKRHPGSSILPGRDNLGGFTKYIETNNGSCPACTCGESNFGIKDAHGGHAVGLVHGLGAMKNGGAFVLEDVEDFNGQKTNFGICMRAAALLQKMAPGAGITGDEKSWSHKRWAK